MKDVSKVLGHDGYFATRLRELMSSVTQQELAEAVGTTRQAISQYMDGSSQPNIEKLYKIANHFHVSTDFLLGSTDAIGSNYSINEISDILGLSENAINLLYKEQHDMMQVGRNSDTYYFSDFVNIFADIDEFDVNGEYPFIDILYFLQYKEMLLDEDNIDLTLAAFRREINQDKAAKMKFYKVLHTIEEKDLLSVFLLRIQQSLKEMKEILETERYFEDGGVSYRLKNKQSEHRANKRICELDNLDIESAEKHFEEKERSQRQEWDDYVSLRKCLLEEWKNLSKEEKANLSFDDLKRFAGTFK